MADLKCKLRQMQATGSAYGTRRRVDRCRQLPVLIGVLIGVVEAEGVADLVGDRRLEVVALDAGRIDAEVDERRHHREEEREDERPRRDFRQRGE